MADNETVVHNLVQLLRCRAAVEPDRVAYRYLADADRETAALTYRQLDQRARAIAAFIRSSHPSGSHALLLYPPGLDFVAALFGCFYAGCVAVPMSLPRRAEALQRIEAVVSHAAVDFILSAADIWHALARRSAQPAVLDGIAVVTTDQLPVGLEQDWVEPSLASSALALLQYTSGSTGSPKGVTLSHGNILDNVRHLVARSDLGAASIGVSWLPLFHDMGLIGGVIAPVFAGFPVALLSPASFLSQPTIWLQAITRYRATVSVAPTFAYELCLTKIRAEQMAKLDLSAWEVAFCGAEPIRADTLDRFAETFAQCGFRRSSFLPCYGLAEATLMVSGGPARNRQTVLQVDREALRTKLVAVPGTGKGAQTLVGCGRPITEGSVVIVDPLSRRRCPDRHVGEIWVCNASVGGGYWNCPEDTRETFGARPVDSDEGPFLRTGDLGFLDDGSLYVAGRIKDLIIIRGANHHPQDIELTVERSHPALRPHAGAALSIEDGGEERLVIVQEVERSWRGDTSSIVDAIRKSIAEEQGIAVHTIVLIKQGTIALTTSGKIQRKQTRAAFASGALAVVASWSAGGNTAADVPLEPPPPALAGRGSDDGKDRLIANAQSVIVRELARILNIPDDLVGLEAPLGSLGLDSLKLFELQGAIAAHLAVHVDAFHFFEDHSIAELASIAANCSQSSAMPPLAPRLQDAGPLPLSFVQERLWFLDQLQSDEAAYNNAAAVRLTGNLNVAALKASFAELVSRHETLRTRFVSADGSPVQLIDQYAGFQLDTMDLSGWPENERAGELDRRSEREATTPFVLSAGALLRATLLRLDADEHVLLLTAHHIVSDAWSLKVLIREIGELYGAFVSAEPSRLPPLPVQYADYAVWQRRWLQGEFLEQQAAYWRRQLAGAPTALDLPADRVRPAVQNFSGGTHEFSLSARLTQELARLAHAEGATPFMVVLAAFQLILARWSGQDDIVVGSPIAGRCHRLIEGLIGFFVNMLPLRTNLAGDPSFRELLQRVKRTAVEAYAHQEIPFEKILEVISPDRTLSHTPVFQVVLNMLDTGDQMAEVAGLRMQILSQATPASKFDLTLYVQEVSKRLTFKLVYNAALFRRDRMSEFSAQIAGILAQIVKNPDAKLSTFSLVTRNARKVLPDPIQRLGGEWFGAVHQLFSKQAARRPDWVAIRDDATSWSYRELDDISNRLANHLRANGVATGDIVAILGHRSAPLVWAILGALKAGAAFTILDPAYPPARLIACMEEVRPRAWLEITAGVTPDERIATLVRDLGGCRVALRGNGQMLADRGVVRASEDNPDIAVGPDDTAVVSFTSGSTGRPKGILGRHGPLSHFIPWQERTFGFNLMDRFSMLSGISHDPLQRDIFTPLCIGATICIPHPDELSMPGGMANWMRRSGATVAHLTPGLGQILSNIDGSSAAAPMSIATLRYAFLVGDVLTRRDVAALRAIAPSVTCVNYYGSTETQRSVAYYVVSKRATEAGVRGEGDKEILPLGKGIEDVQLLVLNGRLRVAGIGELGEIHMRSRHMAAGYFGNDALTAERFFTNPFTGASADRLYRTGDLGRYLPDGNVEFAGRADRQVKIRGHRIELGEIEAILLLLPGIRDAAVVVRESVRDKDLVAYLVMVKGEPPPAVRELRGQLRRMLPDYMVPSAFVMLDALPLTPNGKIDRDRLPEPKRPVAAVAAPPASHTEQVLAGIWADLMKLEQVGRHDNFFELGGHSLLAAQVMARIKRLLNCELPVRALFEAPTVSELSARIQAEQNGLAACELLQIELDSDLAMRPDDETTEAAEEHAWKR